MVIHKGLWWLSDSPDQTVGGELAFDNQRLTLDLLGTLNETVFGSSWPAHRLVLGITTAGDPMTLLDCTLRGRHLPHPGYPTQTYRPRYALVGAHFEDAEAVKFSEVMVRSNHLESWFGSWPLFCRPGKAEADGRYHQEMGYDRVPALKAPLAGASFSAGQNFVVSENPFGANISYQASASFATTTPLTPAEWQDWYLQPWRNFLALASGARTRTLKTEFWPEPDNGAGQAHLSPLIEMIAPGFSYEGERPDRRLPDMLLTLADIRDQIGDVLSCWLAMHRELDYILNLYFGARDNPGLYLEQQFLSVMQALEGFHRHWFAPKPASRRGPELKARLADLIRHVGPVMDPWTAADQADATFAKAASDLRNELSHILDTNAPQQLDSAWLAWVLGGLSWLFEACLLHAIGLPATQVTELVRRNQRYQEVVRRAGKA